MILITEGFGAQKVKRVEDFMNYKDNKQQGQSTIEFLSTIIFALGFFFLFVKIALNATDGYLIHYATFMASRAYMSADTNSNTVSSSQNKAQEMARLAVKSIHISALGYDESALKFNNHSDVSSSGMRNIFVGTYFEFRQKFAAMSVVGGTHELKMVSESFLGKEPSKQECLEQTCKALELPDPRGEGCGALTTVFDNGC
jgi:hypothetical protein